MNRVCIDCGKDLSEEMGVMVFTERVAGKGTVVNNSRITTLLLCIEHGKNGHNFRRIDTLPEGS